MQSFLTLIHRTEFVQARNVLSAAGFQSSLGTYAFGFTWAAWACLLLSTLLFFGGCCIGRNSNPTDKVRSKPSWLKSFRRKGATRSRGSFIDTESQRRVKEEY
jgi:hypothetical protein